MERRAWAVALAFLSALASQPSFAGERLSRRVDWLSGAPLSSVDTLDQDAEGFLWVATPQGLIRYDGQEMRVIDPGLHTIVAGCARSGKVDLIRKAGESLELVELQGTTVTPIATPEHVAGREIHGAACSDDGRLWALFGGELWQRQEPARWTRLATAPTAEEWDGLWPGLQGSILVRSGSSVLRVNQQGVVETLARLHLVVSCYLRNDGTLIALDWRRNGGYLLAIRHNKVEELAFRPHRPIALVERRNTIWAAFDAGLVGIRSDGTEVEILSSPSSMNGGGQLLVDRENALWVGTIRGLVQFPEPDTAGLDPDLGGRWLLRLDHKLILSTWSGAYEMVERKGRNEFIPSVTSIGAVCKDSRDRTWTVFFESLDVIDARGRTRKVPFEHVGSMAPCVLDT